MVPTRADEAARALRGIYHGEGHKMIMTVFTDSRESALGGTRGELFAAIRGSQTDGHLFVEKLAASGTLCLIDREEFFSENTILVKDVKAALYDLALFYREKKIPHVKTVAVTGSAGKTTVKDMTKLTLAAKFDTCATKGNQNSLIGAPLSILSIDPGRHYAVIEAGMSEPGEISRLSALIKPSLSIITNIGSAHLEALHTRENLIKEKFDILSGAAENSAVILDGDAAYEYSLKGALQHRTIYCGTANSDCDFYAENIHEKAARTGYDACWEGKKAHISLPAVGLHNVKNSLYAFAAAVCCGVPPEMAAKALSRFEPTGDRQRIYEKNGVTVIADCYNASPESMKAALSVLASRPGRKIAVLGDMLELGEGEKRFHAENALLAADAADIVIFYGDFAAFCKNALPGNDRAYAFCPGEKQNVVSLVKSLVKPGDVVLFKGSRRMRIDTIIKETSL